MTTPSPSGHTPEPAPTTEAVRGLLDGSGDPDVLRTAARSLLASLTTMTKLAEELMAEIERQCAAKGETAP